MSLVKAEHVSWFQDQGLEPRKGCRGNHRLEEKDFQTERDATRSPNASKSVEAGLHRRQMSLDIHAVAPASLVPCS